MYYIIANFRDATVWNSLYRETFRPHNGLLVLGGIGIFHLSGNWEVIKAFNPYYAYKLIVNSPSTIIILGAVFLCTTGAEALYSDLGH